MKTFARFGLRVGFAAATAWASLVRAEPWPEVKPPPNARVESIASDMLLNGKHTRLTRYEVRATSAEVLAFYREQFGARRVVENRVKNDPVIATRQGDHFVTVQLHELAGGAVQGTVMTTRLSATASTSPVLMDTQKVLPSDTKVVSTVQTSDAGKQALMVVAVNRNSPRANRDHVLEALLARGFRLTKDETPPDGQQAGLISLQLVSPTEEASVTISDNGRHRTVLINRVRGAP